MGNNSNIKALTGIRAVAAILIFVFHARKYWFSSIPIWVNNILLEFHIGVSIFFVLSGFLIAYTYKAAPLQSTSAYAKYLLLRFLRIMPMYLIILFLKYLLEGLPTTNNLWLQVTLTNAATNNYNLEGISQAWSLFVELMFYIVAPLCFLLIHKRVYWLFYLIAILLLIGINIGYIIYNVNKNPHAVFYPLIFILQGSFWGRSFEFLFGVFIASIVLKNGIKQYKGFAYTLLGSIGIVTVLSLLVYIQPSSFESSSTILKGVLIRNMILPIAVGVFIYGLVHEINLVARCLSTTIFVILGNASFIFYLIHIGAINNVVDKKFGAHIDRNFFVLYIISILLFYLIDKPLYKLCKKMISERKIKNA